MAVLQNTTGAVPRERGLREALLRPLFVPVTLLATGAAVVLAAFMSWAVWRLVPTAPPAELDLHLRFGCAAALLVGVFTLVRGEHRLSFYAARESSAAKVASVWNLSFALLFALAFLTRRVDDLSRGTVVLFYVSGFVALWSTRLAIDRTIRIASKLRVIVARRLVVVGTKGGISAFLRRHQPWNLGFEVIGTVVVPSLAAGETPSPDLLRAVEFVRSVNVDDVYIAVPWSDVETIDACVEAFMTTPTTLHLAPERVLDRFGSAVVSRVGAMASLELTRPMSPAAVAAKRLFDLAAASAALVVLSPLFLVVAILIKLDSRGPVFFLQSRYGFNQRRFRIVKFRTMSTFSDDEVVPQAARNDSRITRVGAYLRRTNLDELPQLLNVVLGQMSLVGPRPHAVPHNRAYERRIALYARRHNVRPGITGWAQVNGHRGETETDEKMTRRVEHDLFYIDNWSMLFDLRIILRTVFSAKAYRNAY